MNISSNASSSASGSSRRPPPPGNIIRTASSTLLARPESSSSSSSSVGGNRSSNRNSRSLLDSPGLEYNRSRTSTGSSSASSSPSIGANDAPSSPLSAAPRSPSLSIIPSGPSTSPLPRSESITSASSFSSGRRTPALVLSSSPHASPTIIGRGMDLSERPSSRNSNLSIPRSPSSPVNLNNGLLAPGTPSSPVHSSHHASSPAGDDGSVGGGQTRRRAGSGNGEIALDDLRKALEGVSRDDLLIALGRTKQQIDQSEAEREDNLLHIETLQSHVSELNDRFSTTRSEMELLHAQIAAREEKMEEMLKDQERLEDEVYSKAGVLDRVRKQLDEMEKGRAEAERRYVDQSTTLDKERQYYTDAEALMQSQKVNVQNQLDKLAKQNAHLNRENERMVNKLAKLQPLADSQKEGAAVGGGGAAGRRGANNVPEGQIEIATGEDDYDDEMTALDRGMASVGVTHSSSNKSLQDDIEAEQLRSELQSIQRSHGSLQATMQRLQMELKEVKNQNRELRDQNETFQGVLEERTFSGSLLKNSALLRGAGRAVGASDADSTADDDGSEDDDATTETDDTSVSIDDVDDVEDEPKTPRTKASDRKERRQHGGVAVKRGRDGRQEISTEGGMTAALPTDLASELENAQDEEDEQDGNADVAKQRKMERRRKRSGTLSTDVKELQDEVMSLRDANKGLTLYISKIIDRIISREGYENVLAAEPERKRTMRGASSGGTVGRRTAQRASILPINRSPENDSQAPAVVFQPSSQQTDRQSKRQSISILGFNRSNTSDAPPPALNETSKPLNRRTTSVDWRGLLASAGAASSPASTTNQSNFRPLALSSAASSRQPSLASVNAARKVETHEEMEDEHDMAERERIRASLQLQGIIAPAHQLKQAPGAPAASSSPLTQAGSRASGAWGGFISRVISTSSSAGTSGSPNPQLQSPIQENTAGFMGPRLTTFDDPTPARPQQSARSPALEEQRQQAMQATQMSANGTGLTELPTRTTSRLSNRKTTDPANTSFSSRSGSVAGDESYAQPSGTSMPAEEEEEPGWKRALKRVSLLASAAPST